MSPGAVVRRSAGPAVAAFLGLCTLTTGPALATAVDARVVGTFSMRATVTSAVNVPGEHVGQVVTRRWVISAGDCWLNVCPTLSLHRQRSDHRYANLRLHRVAVGRYSGTGSFYTPLRCEGRVYRRGSRAPYTITLTVAGTSEVGGVMFARQIEAAYENQKRSDATPCPLGPSHDAARYSGNAISPLPVAPSVSFGWTVDDADDVATFTDSSSSGTGGPSIFSSVWSFGDPRSGSADHSLLADPQHQFSAPGVYDVSLTDVNAAGLFSTVTEAVTVPAPIPLPVALSRQARPAAVSRAPAPARRRGAQRAPGPA